MKNYYGTKKYLLRFLESKYKLPDIRLKQLNGPEIQKGKKCTNNGAMKHLERLMKMVKLGVKLEWLDKDPFINYRLRFHKTERSYLTERELRLIEETDFTGVGYENQGCVSLLVPYWTTHIDVKTLTPDHLHKGIDGNEWLFTKRIKTDEKLKIPLLPQAREIIKKYEDSPERKVMKVLLPVYSNQKVNYYLKEICKTCKIYKKVTFHTARHTFTTTITLSNGVPIETVSKMLGHTKLSTTQIYARVLQEKVGEDMQKVMDLYSNKLGLEKKAKV